MNEVIQPRTSRLVISGRLSRPDRRRILQLLLGAVWLLDAILQFQPYMFSRSFVTQVIEPGAAGNPAVISRPITWSAGIMAHHIALYNAAFATIQLAIAAGIFWRRTARAALAASIAWAVSVWWFGEGLGGILTSASPLAGLPGAVILYALIAVLAWPESGPDPGTVLSSGSNSVALSGPLGRFIPRMAWLALWAALGWYQLVPGNRAPDAVSKMFASGAAGQPGWVKFADNGLASLTAQHGLAASLVIWALCLLTGFSVFSARLTRAGLVLACLLGLLIWAAEGFGFLLSGQATDPNSGPLLMLLAACFWPVHGPAGREVKAHRLGDVGVTWG
jgi:hypothetical protein